MQKKNIEQKYDKTFNWHVLASKWEINLFTKQMKEKKKWEIREISHLEIIYIIECF